MWRLLCPLLLVLLLQGLLRPPSLLASCKLALTLVQLLRLPPERVQRLLL